MTQDPKTLNELTENFLQEVNANCYVEGGVIRITHECLTELLKDAIRKSAEKTVYKHLPHRVYVIDLHKLDEDDIKQNVLFRRGWNECVTELNRLEKEWLGEKK